MGGRVIQQTHIAICVLALVVIAACSPHGAVSTEVRHVDPATVGHTYSVGYLLSHVSAAISGLAAGNPQGAMLLARTDPSGLNLPPAMTHVWSRYQTLVHELSDTIDILNNDIAGAEEALDSNRLEEAQLALARCNASLGKTQENMVRLEAATAEIVQLARRFGRSEEASSLTQAASSLDSALTRLKNLLQSLAERVELAQQTATAKHGLLLPSLSCHLSTDNAWLGDSIVASGRLSDGPVPMDGRMIHILFNGNELTTDTTDADGSYRVSFSVPFDYVPRASVVAVFVPEDTDADRYLSADSAPCNITVRYHRSTIELSLPDRLHPGLPAELAGQLSSLGPVVSRHVTVLLDGREVGAAFTSSNGSFRCTLHVPEEITTGDHTLRVLAKEDSTGLAAPAESTLQVEVTQVTPQLSLRFPSVVFYPLFSVYPGGVPRSLDSDEGPVVDVRVTSPLPLATSVIRGSWNRGDLPATDARSITSVYSPSTHLLLSGWQDVHVETTAVEPWHTTATAHGRFFVVNLFLAVPAALLCLLIATWALLRQHRSHQALSSPVEVRTSEVGDKTRPAATTSPGRMRFSPRSAVVIWYWAAIYGIANRLNLTLSPAMTLREVSMLAARTAPALHRLLNALTLLAEEALYSGRSVSQRQAATARWTKVYITRSFGAVSREQPGGEP